MTKKLIGTADAARKQGVTQRRLRMLCDEGRIAGAQKVAGVWLIPTSFRIKAGSRGPRLRVHRTGSR
jgi:hypothetical protein